MARRSGYIRIDVEELINEIDDDDLLDECHRRKLTPAGPGETCDLDIVREAYQALLCNRNAEARVILDRLLFPKWRSIAKCQTDYQRQFMRVASPELERNGSGDPHS